jgi:hypothetical protein
MWQRSGSVQEEPKTAVRSVRPEQLSLLFNPRMPLSLRQRDKTGCTEVAAVAHRQHYALIAEELGHT